MAKTTDELISEIKQAKIAREAEQLIKNSELEVALAKQRAERQWATDDWDAARALIESAVDDTNRKLIDANIELVLVIFQNDALPNELRRWLLHFTPTSQGLNHRIQVELIPFLAGSLQVEFKEMNSSTASETRSYTTAGFAAQQADMIINRMLEMATS